LTGFKILYYRPLTSDDQPSRGNDNWLNELLKDPVQQPDYSIYFGKTVLFR